MEECFVISIEDPGHPDGRAPETLWDFVNVGVGIVTVAVDLYRGDTDAAIESGIALAVDVGATLIPFIPGGASTALRGARSADRAKDTVRTLDRASDTSRAESRAGDGVRQASNVAPKCFAAGTLVESARGLMPIEDIETGDWIWSRDEVSGTEDWNQVKQVFVTPAQELIELELSDGGDLRQVLKVTAEHPIWSFSDGGWTSAGSLDLGEYVDALDGKLMLSSMMALPALETVYNLEFEHAHTYFVGETGFGSIISAVAEVNGRQT